MSADVRLRLPRMRFFFSLLMLAPLLIDCDPIYGAQTVAYLSNSINIECIEGAINHTDGAGDVEHRHFSNESFGLFPAWGKIITVSNSWTYGPGGEVMLQILTTNRGDPAEYTNGHTKMGSDDHKSNAFIPLMRDVDRSVEQRCGLPVSSQSKLQNF